MTTERRRASSNPNGLVMDRILAAAANFRHSGATIDQIASAIGESKDNVARRMNELLQRGKLRGEGPAHERRFYLVQEAPVAA